MFPSGRRRLAACLALAPVAVASWVLAAQLGDPLAIAWAAALATGIGHPLARAIVKRAIQGGLTPGGPPADFKAVDSVGISGTVDGVFVRAGRTLWLATVGLVVPLAFRATGRRWTALGAAVVWVALGSEIVGGLVMRRDMRPSAG